MVTRPGSHNAVRDVVTVGYDTATNVVSVVGGKARTLSALARDGFPVPPAVVLTTSACARVAAASGEVPAEIRAAIAAALGGLGGGGGRLAVRSSAVEEDSRAASYAGAFRSVLNVAAADLGAVCDAVADVVASASEHRVAVYRQRVEGDARAPGAPCVAVMLQRQLEPEAAGVAFTADPVTGDRDVAVVSAVRGLADRLLEGAADGERWRVREGVATRVGEAGQPVLAAAQATRICDLARRIADHLGSPQDVEWAIEGGVVHVLQARPITALPTPPATDLPAGSWIKESGRRTELMTPFGASVALPMVSDGLAGAFAQAGGLLERIEMRSVGGEVYLRVVPVGGHTGAPPPWPVLGILARVAPPLRARCRAARDASRPGVAEALVDEWLARWRPQIVARTEQLRVLDVTTMRDDELGAHLEESVELLRRGLAAHFRLMPPYAVAVHHLVRACRDLLGWDEARALELLGGTSSATSEPTRALAGVAALVSDVGAVRTALSAPGADVRARLCEVDERAGTAFAEWCDRYALRVLGEDPGAPTLAEQPALLASLLDAELARAGSPRDVVADRQHVIERARAALAPRAPKERRRFETALAAAERVYPTREDSAVWAACHPAGLVRRAAVEAGRRLARRRALDRADDVVYLDVETVLATLRNRRAGLRATASRARAEQAWVAAHPGPAFIGAPPAPSPDVRGLPAHARAVNEALLWAQRQQRSKPAPQGHAGVLSGVAGAPGRHTGPVRVVRHFAQFTKVRPGDVVVCPATDPSWSVLFGIVGAVVTEGGGALSHTSIVAREHATPAVLGVSAATTALRDDQLVTVDGTTGRVWLASPVTDSNHP